MEKKRVNWEVGLYRYNLSEKLETYPRVQLRGTVTLQELADVMEKRTGIYKAENTRAILSIMEKIIEDYLIEGYAVSGNLGTLTPTVTGMWGHDRIQPAVREQNKAVIRYAMSSRLKEDLANPLFRTIPRRETGPTCSNVNNVYAANDGRQEWHPRDVLIIKGSHLLMNGDHPDRGLYFINAETNEAAAHITPDTMLQNTRSVIMATIPALPPGNYRLRVVSQCTTSPRPLHTPQTGETKQAWHIK